MWNRAQHQIQQTDGYWVSLVQLFEKVHNEKVEFLKSA